MKNTAVEDLFLREETLTNTAEAVKTSAVRNWKRWGRDHSKDLGISVWLMNASKQTAGAVTLTLKSCDTEGGSFAAIASATGSVGSIDSAARLIFLPLPRMGIKEFVKVEVTTDVQFTVAPIVSVGLDNDSENEIDATMVQPKIG